MPRSARTAALGWSTAALALLGCVRDARAIFSTTLHGAPTEIVEPWTPGVATMELQPWLTTYDPLAVCNDNTPAGYYLKTGTDKTLWMVYLEGGYWCWDGPSCTERYQTLKFDMSSSGWGKLFAQDGLFSTDITVNPWANANMIFVKYCSSDSWFGDAGNSSSTFGFSFRGARIVLATITGLVQQNGMGSSGGPERLLFAGCSAGGRGVLSNLDAVAAAVPSNVQVQGLLDAAAWVDIQPIIPNMMTLQDMTVNLYGFTTPPVPAACAAQYTGQDAWKCMWPSYRLPYVKTNYFLNAAQFDAFQIMYDTNNLDSTYCCETPQEQQWVEQFQTQTLELFQQIPSTNVVFSSACFVHCLSSNADYWEFTVNGVSLMQAMSEWYFSNTPTNVIESCTGWDCTLQCSGGPWQPSNTPCASTTNVCANTYMYSTPPTPVGGSSSTTPPVPGSTPATAAAPTAAQTQAAQQAAQAAQLAAQQAQLQQQQQQQQAQQAAQSPQAQAAAVVAPAAAPAVSSASLQQATLQAQLAAEALMQQATSALSMASPPPPPPTTMQHSSEAAEGPAPGPTALPVVYTHAPKDHSRSTAVGGVAVLASGMVLAGWVWFNYFSRPKPRYRPSTSEENRSLL